MLGRKTVAVTLGAGLLLLGACGLDSARNTEADDNTVDGQITSVRLASESGDVKIHTGDRTTVRRTVHYDKDKPGSTHHVEGNVLVIDSCPVRGCSIDYDLTVPAGTKVDGVVDSGEVDLDGVASVNLTVSSGGVTARRVSGGVNLSISSGSVNLTDVGAAVAVRSESGDVTLAGVRGKADVQSESGDVTVGMGDVQNVRASANSGRIAVTVPRGAYRVTLDTDSGSVTNEVGNDQAADHELHLTSSSGDLSVRYA